LTGLINRFASTPDADPLDIAGDIDIEVEVEMTDWTPTANEAFVSKYGPPVAHQSYLFYCGATTGKLVFVWREPDETFHSVVSDDPTGFTNGTRHWVRVTMDVDNGSTEREIKFYTREHGVDPWVQFGATITQAGTTSILVAQAVVEIGASSSGANNNLDGKFYRVILKDGINGTVVFDAEFDKEEHQEGSFPSFNESSSNAFPVTLFGGDAALIDPQNVILTAIENEKLIAVLGTYALAAPTTNLLWDHEITAALGTYSLAGVDADFSVDFGLIADLGTYSLAAPAVTFDRAYILTAALGTYALAGIAINLFLDRALIAVLGTYSLAGIATNTLWDHKTPAALGTYSLVGVDVGFSENFGLIAAIGTYSLVGAPVELDRNFGLLAELGTYSLVGNVAILNATFLDVPQTAPYNLVGLDVELSHKGAVAGWEILGEDDSGWNDEAERSDSWVVKTENLDIWEKAKIE